MKKLYIFLISSVLFIGILMFFLSSIAQWYVVKNSNKLVGRRIHIENIHFNYFKVSVRIQKFVLYETNGKDPFVSFNELYVNFDPWALLKKEYAFSEIRLINPTVAVVQNGAHFNFDDLIHAGNTAQTSKTKNSASSNIRFLVRNIKISGGLLKYTDQHVKSQVDLQKLDLDIPMIAWDSNQSDVGIRFRIGEHGFVKLGAMVNNPKQFYSLTLDTRDLDLNIITNYLKPYMSISKLQGNLTSTMVFSGKLDTITSIQVRGIASIHHLSIVDNSGSTVLAAEKVTAKMKKIDLGQFHFGFSKITTTNARLLAILNKKSVNLMDFFQPYFKADSLAKQHADSTSLAATSPLTYSIDTLQLENSIVNFKDNTLNRPFLYDLKNINLTMYGLTESATHVPIVFSMNLNDKGSMKGTYTFNMQHFTEFKTNLTITKMDLVSFSPYSEYYIASPITQGYFSYDIMLEMSKTKLKNENRIKIDALEFGRRTHDKTAVKVPVRLALYILKDPQNKIAFELPVEGNPSEPKFSLSKIIWKTVGNFCLKVALEPFKAMSGLVSVKPEDINKLPFEPTQDTLSIDNLKTVHLIAELSRKKPGLKFKFIQYTDLALEKEKIAVLLAKERFIRSKSDNSDSLVVANMVSKVAVTDNDFKAYLASNVENGATMEPVKACAVLVGDKRLDNELLLKINRRNWSLQKALGIYEKLPEESFRIETADLNNIPDELKTMMYKVEVDLSE